MLIAAASTAATSAVDPVAPPAAASTQGRHHALRDVLRFQQVLKANAKDVYLPNFGDTSEDEESEEKEEKCVADKQKKGVVSKKAAQNQKKTPPELLIAAASTTAASAVDPVTHPAAASTRGRHHALRDVVRSQQVLKANVKDVDLPIFGDSSSDEESEEEE